MFYEEARELLIGLEEGLMDLERRQGDRAHLDKTFRAAHSLKGAAAMVGLGALAEFTHGIEAVLERVRSGALKVDSDIITTLLEARDHLAAMVEGEAAKSPIPASSELNERLNARCARLGSGGGASGLAPPRKLGATPGDPPPRPPPAAPDAPAPRGTFRQLAGGVRGTPDRSARRRRPAARAAQGPKGSGGAATRHRSRGPRGRRSRR